MIADVVRDLLTVLLLASLAYFGVALLAARRFASRRSASPRSGRPPASILVPLSGAGTQARELYASLCLQDYPAYQVIFGVHRDDDPSVPVVRDLMKAHPERNIELVVSGEDASPNPKIRNLHHMLARARHEVVVMVDGDIRVARDFLASVLPPLSDERVGLVTCLYRSGEAAGLADRLEAVGITGEFAPGVLVAWLTEGMSFALGAVMAIRRSVLHSIGGLEALAPYLADDYRLGNLVRQAGHEVYLSSHVVETFMTPSRMMPMLRHQLRWSRATRASRPRSYLGLFVTHGTTLALLALLIEHDSLPDVLLPAITILAQHGVAWAVGIHALGDRVLRRNLWLLPLRDLLGFGIWCVSLLGHEVEWQGTRYTVEQGGKLVPVRSK